MNAAMDDQPGSTRCPCGSGARYAACCGPLHAGKRAPTAVQVMRARYTAYVRGDQAYLLRSWAAEERPGSVSFDPGHVWTMLDVLGTDAGGMLDDQGTVEFNAHYERAGVPGVLHEASVFRREDGEWRYVGPVAASLD